MALFEEWKGVFAFAETTVEIRLSAVFVCELLWKEKRRGLTKKPRRSKILLANGKLTQGSWTCIDKERMRQTICPLSERLARKNEKKACQTTKPPACFFETSADTDN